MSTSAAMVSIIMPAYNSARYISDSIASVQAQTWTNWELIIIDDCSTDQTAEIISSFAMSDSRIKQLTNKVNSGVAQSRNTGIANALGHWIAFLDSDDCWTPDKLARQIAFAHKQAAEFTFTGSAFMDENSSPLSHYLSVPQKVSYTELLKQNIVSCSSVLIKRNLLLPYPMASDDMHEDFAVWLQILRDTKICAYGLDQPLLIYRISASSKSGNKIKAACMTFRVYRFIGLKLPAALYYWGWYTVKSLFKYRKLRGK